MATRPGTCTTTPKSGQVTAEYVPVATTSSTPPTSNSYAGYIKETFTYDNRGDLLSSTDGNGNTTSYTYDLLGHVLTETQPDPDGTSGPLPAPVTDYVYDADGNLISTTARHRQPATNHEHRLRQDGPRHEDGQPRWHLHDRAVRRRRKPCRLDRRDGPRHAVRLRLARNRQIATIQPDGSVAYDRIRRRRPGRRHDRRQRQHHAVSIRHAWPEDRGDRALRNVSAAVTIDDSSGYRSFSTTSGSWTTSRSGNGGYDGGYTRTTTSSGVPRRRGPSRNCKHAAPAVTMKSSSPGSGQREYHAPIHRL